jgi:hypothetical protein
MIFSITLSAALLLNKILPQVTALSLDPPQHYPNGSCFAYHVKAKDGCYDLAQKNGIADWTVLEGYNTRTWGWTGCLGLQG